MNFTPDELLLLRMALIAWQAHVFDHSFHEIMLALDGYQPVVQYPKDHTRWLEVYETLWPADKPTLTIRNPKKILALLAEPPQKLGAEPDKLTFKRKDFLSHLFQNKPHNW